MKKRKQNKTIGMLLTQQKFYLASQYLLPLASVLKEGFAQYVRREKGKHLSARNLAMAHAMKYAVKGDYPELYVDPAFILLSDGSVQGIKVEDIMLENDALRLDFDGGEITPLNHDDELLLVAYDPIAGVAIRNEMLVTRSSSGLRLELPDYMKNVRLDVFVLVRDRNRNRYSRSQYAGNV
ncbi:hypothetical protein HS960_19720 [Sphingobacterium paramultivorum]|uniref:Uncharacterized protein n=1 Tax=Sphingobacterium paramultivorum TaxID=2886510 RepID=A0A7G5E6W7_9SPHI|nr:DUF6266 family protein [Sphingobacterium paramultivorum]QMV69742.1 hypothetical protein HS960_19720 [Sphingobacterium paramultivorum]WSO13564.1 DUF6266 family protein [Sphingobacterium paramultivorum]